MGSVFLKQIISKSNSELVEILVERRKYVPEIIKVALEEIKKRDIHNNHDSAIDIQELISVTEQECQKKEELDKIAIAKRSTGNDFSKWLPWTHIYDLVGYYSLCLIFLLMLWFPYFDLTVDYWPLAMLLLVVPLWQGQILYDEESKRSIHFHQRLIFSYAAAFFLVIRTYLVMDKSSWYLLWVFLFSIPVILVLGGIVSFLMIIIPFKKLNHVKWYFLDRLKLFIPISITFLSLFVVLEEGWFVEEHNIPWSQSKPLSFDDFVGYPDLFTTYDASIYSAFNYEFDENDHLIKLEAVCRGDDSWVNPWDDDSYSLLMHEQYHFNITELAVRKARQQIFNNKKEEISRADIEDIITSNIEFRDELQRLYDEESDHSVIRDKQGYWQYKIDSFLYELDAYWTSALLEYPPSSDTLKYFRNITINSKRQIVGLDALQNGEDSYTPHYQFHFDKNKTLRVIEFIDQGQLSEDHHFGAGRVVISDSSKFRSTEFYDINGEITQNTLGYAKELMYRKGDKLVLNYFDVNDHQIDNGSNEFENILQLDTLGRVIAKISYDQSGRVITSASGVQTEKYMYSDQSSLFFNSLKYFDANDYPAKTKRGVHQIIFKRDQSGRSIYERTCGPYNEDAPVKGRVYQKRIYNEFGYLTELAYYGSDDHLIEDSKGAAKSTWSYDRYGNVNRESNYNGNNVLVNDDEGVATSYYQYDQNSNLLSYQRYGTGDEMVFDEGYGKEVYEYDSLNRMISIKNYDAYGHPSRSEYNSFLYKIFRDSSDNQTTLLFFNEKLEPDTTSDGSHKSIQKFDPRGNLIEKSFYDLQGSLLAVEQDVAIFEYDYDERDNKVESRFYNIHKELAFANQGISINKYVFSNENRIIERSYHDSTGSLAPFDGVARFQWVHDNKGNEIEEWRFNQFNMLLDSGTAIVKNKYDGSGNRIEFRNFDNKQELVKTGPAIVMISYNKFNEVVREEHLNHFGLPTINDKDSVYTYEYFYDDENRYLGMRFIGTNQIPKQVDGIAQVIVKVGDRGNTESIAYLDSLSNLTEDKSGVAVYNYQYDLYDREITYSYLGSDSLPTKYDGFFAKIECERDRSGNISKKVYYDEMGQLAINSDSIAMYTYKYDRNGYYTTWSYTLEETKKKLSQD